MRNKALIVAWIAALSMINSPKIDAQKIDSSKAVIENFDEKWKNINSFELSHEEIIHMDVDSLLGMYWKERWLEIINEHFLIELNNLRKEHNSWNLVVNDTIIQDANEYAKGLYENDKLEHWDWEFAMYNRLLNKGLKFDLCWENLAWNYRNILDLIKWWEDSHSHLLTMIYKKYTRCWLWYHKSLWVYVTSN